ncbi:OmpA family protein [Thermomonospora cellulosilytica]|uniref:Outer membrane protein OmpA-like peptidoglycan-associated protein n=1 Tax=Thermomonospora cellulosilytica TaxID=1411118 RepID=A0A7W3MXH3_9ACTN|nr:OmpA family protein [Thermomonospora cellulosilytica]MBA9003622.1 outer membrane protein OmpA-like peptidoglycan-associated protein [Thermomonospora cellulosilytica]
MRGRATLPAVVAALVLLPGAAAAAPEPTDQEIAASVTGIETVIDDIDLNGSIVPLQEEVGGGDTVTVRINTDVLFGFGDATLTEAAKRTIERLAPRLRGASGAVRVVGHTDAIGSDGANLELSRRRAEAVRAELARLLGAGARIEAEGRGETAPVAPNTTPDGKDDPVGRAKNRRVEITFAG